MVQPLATPQPATCTIALVGKYVKLHDAYLSVVESPVPRRYRERRSKVEIQWVDSETLVHQDRLRRRILADVDGIIVPGGFGDRGIEGMIAGRPATPVRTRMPYFGICLGMQMAW